MYLRVFRVPPSFRLSHSLSPLSLLICPALLCSSLPSALLFPFLLCAFCFPPFSDPSLPPRHLGPHSVCVCMTPVLQVIYGVFLLFCPIGEAVSQTVQTYLPGFTVQRPPSADGTPRKTLTFGKVQCFVYGRLALGFRRTTSGTIVFIHTMNQIRSQEQADDTFESVVQSIRVHRLLLQHHSSLLLSLSLVRKREVETYDARVWAFGQSINILGLNPPQKNEIKIHHFFAPKLATNWLFSERRTPPPPGPRIIG